MTWPFKSKPSRPAFAVGKYKIGDPIDIISLIEFSEVEYKVFERRFKHERNFHAGRVEFLGYSWDLMLGTVAGKIFKIALCGAFDSKGEANPVAIASLRYCTELYGKPSSEETGLFFWKTTDGNVILQTAGTDEGFGINLFIKSSAVREFEQM
jgi:hypothetical protein